MTALQCHCPGPWDWGWAWPLITAGTVSHCVCDSSDSVSQMLNIFDCSRANRALGFIKRNVKVRSPRIKEKLFFFFFFQYCAGQRFIAALSHTGGQARKNLLEFKLRLWFEGDGVKEMM